MINIYNKYKDSVISSVVLLGDTTYQYALDCFLPLINRFESQRRIMDEKFYDRLCRDIKKGCMMPPITLAFVCDDDTSILSADVDVLKDYVNKNISNGYILDGLQRLNTLKRASVDSNFPVNHSLLLNIIVAENEDKLLYRMITLNNGQKPMSPRHQIEILTQGLFDFSNYPNLNVQTEKEKHSPSSIKDSYSLADISKAYLAFITESIIIDNSKFIEEKMDQILVRKILDTDISSISVEFKQILSLLNRWQTNTTLKKWFKTPNNLIAFCVGIKKSYFFINSLDELDLVKAISAFDEAFTAINPSKVNVGKIRRELVEYYVSNLEQLINLSVDDLINDFFDKTA